MTLEREDIGANSNDPLLVAMHQVAPPYGEARDDYDIFAALADRLGMADAFTEGADQPGMAGASVRSHPPRACGAGFAGTVV